MGDDAGPKQYRMLGGRSVLQRALDFFLTEGEISQCVVVIHRDDGDLYRQGTVEHDKLLEPVSGGATRQASVLEGLRALKVHAPQNVLIHDAARPFVDASTIARVIGGITPQQAALPSLPVADTVKRGADGLVVETVERNGLYVAQTPQGFDFPTILAAHESAAMKGLDSFTDDCALAEWAGLKVALVEGNRDNMKITTRQDMQAAQAKTATAPDIRVGHGYDTHRWAVGKSLWLCGVQLDHDRGLDGHSDADVGLHALTDALLSAIADGDIGSHFPPSDPQWKDARSRQFLEHAARRVRERGGQITHCDVTLICEAPKIGRHRDAMRAEIADCIGIEVARVGVKATTNERLGYVGREEGMTALATATVVMSHVG